MEAQIIMKEKYDNLTEFLNDILEAAEVASKNIVKDINDKNKDKNQEKSKSNVISNINEDQKKQKFVDSSCKNLNNNYVKSFPSNIVINDDSCYILKEMCNDWPTFREQILIFEHYTEDGYKIPGITESQLLTILYNRYKNNPKKLELVRQLMN